MTRVMTSLACTALLATAIATASDEISLEDVPENVLDMASRTAPGVTFDRVSIEVENGLTVYEFEAEDHAGRHIEIDVDESGRLEEIEMETDLEDVPPQVMITLANTAPGFTPDYIELSVRESGRYFVYEFEGRLDGARLNIEIAENGELLLVSDELSS